ncbi:MAG: hypothetical protein Tsb0032_18660 [Kiloniellaceae bacterium]
MFAPATKPSPFQVFDGLGQFLARSAAAVASAWEAHRVYQQLSSLSASELAARGLSREDISRMTLRALNSQL